MTILPLEMGRLPVTMISASKPRSIFSFSSSVRFAWITSLRKVEYYEIITVIRIIEVTRIIRAMLFTHVQQQVNHSLGLGWSPLERKEVLKLQSSY